MVNTMEVMPLYKQVEADLIGKMDNGEYKPGEMLPAGKDLCDLYGVSSITIKKALTELAEQGRVVRIQGKGTFVANKTFRQVHGTRAIGFSERCASQNIKASSKLILAEVTDKMPDNVRKDLELDDIQKAIHIIRVRYMDNNPLLIEDVWFPMHYAYLLDQDLNKASLYDTIRKYENGNVQPMLESGTNTIRLVNATTEQAKLLDLKPGTTLLYFYGRTLDRETGRPIHAGANIGYAQKYNIEFVY